MQELKPSISIIDCKNTKGMPFPLEIEEFVENRNTKNKTFKNLAFVLNLKKYHREIPKNFKFTGICNSEIGNIAAGGLRYRRVRELRFRV